MHDCPVCLADDSTVFEVRSRVPVLQNVIVKSREDAARFPTGAIEMRSCSRCGFVWNAAFDPAIIDYGADYDNSVQASGVYLKHQADMAERVLRNADKLDYLEIGCGAGEFLEVLDRTGRLHSAVGFDPAFKGQRRFGDHITIHREYFTLATSVEVPANITVVGSRHTIEHIPNPRDFVRDIARFVQDRNVRLFLETPDVDWIFRNVAFEDFFYEHCSIFTHATMRRLLGDYGLSADVSAVYNGQYMWVEATAGAPSSTEFDGALPKRYMQQSRDALDHWRREVKSMRADGPVAVWGAASKGVTFALLVDGIDCAIDLNPTKQGCFMPVSATPIVSPEAAVARGVASIIVMNPNYEAEIRAKVKAMGWAAQVRAIR
jgi:SAM-dependent methyltransferase